jgi:hypothetical protein
LGNGPGNAAFVGDSEYDGILTLHAEHRCAHLDETQENNRKRKEKGSFREQEWSDISDKF